MSLPFDDIVALDFETYYDDTYSLRKQFTTDYIRDERFEAQTCAIQWLGVDDEPSVAVGHPAIAKALTGIDWTRTALLAHHTQFDGLICTHHFGVYPAFWLDTLSMARAVFGVDESVSLNAVAQKLGLKGKVHAQALVDVKGKHLADMAPEDVERLAEYNADDTSDTAAIFEKLQPFVPDDELRIIDITLRMFTEPTLIVDAERVARVNEEERTRKQELFARIGVDVKDLGSAAKFAALLESFGVEPPRKISARTGKITYAFSKNDYEFKSLLSHEDERVQWLVEARLASKSTLVETRSETILRRAGRPTPIYLNYWGARTGRWSGGDGANWQNLPKRGLGGELRKSLTAPKGTMLVVSDASQIEARMLAWQSGQEDVLETFASGEDVYCQAASMVYGEPVYPADENGVYTNPVDKLRRFVGKVLTLGAGYGAGAAKINYMLKIGAFGPPVIQAIEETQEAINAWRAARRYIVQEWKNNNANAKTAFLNYTDIDDGVVVFEGTKRGGYIHLPNGTYIFYPNARIDPEDGEFRYTSRNGDVKLYGGLLTENKTQALARVLLSQQMLMMEDEMPDMRIAGSTHDEVMLVVPEKKAKKYATNVQRIMSTAPAWAAGIPLNADTQVSRFYEKS